jgi:DNA polymerase IV (DinB-like DNA polymerase)
LPGSRVVMLVDFDYFYAQVEEMRNPSIKDKPVVVCVYSGRTQDSGAVATANYIAREHGVRSGIPIALAKKRLKDVEAVFLPMDRAYYEEVSDRLMILLRGYADSFEQVGIDEAYLDVSVRTNGNFKEARWLGYELKEKIKAQEGITCSIGIAPNKLLSKIASDVQKPDGLAVVEPDEIESFLSAMPVGRIIGIGAKTEKKMGELGISTVGDLAEFDVQKLIETFGKTLGSYFHSASLGVDDDPVQDRGEATSISRIATLKENTRDLNVITEKTNQLSEEVYSKLAERGLTYKSVGIVAVMSDLTVHSRSRTFENQMGQLDVIKRTARELFDRFLGDSVNEVRRVGVRVSCFDKPEKEQSSLTDFMQPGKETS